jgi:hypothetical protein
MAKFNSATATKTRARGPIKASATKTTVTHEGAPAYSRDAKSDLFLLAVSNMVGEATFYESASDRDNRFGALVRQVAVEDFDWFSVFLPWLRAEGNMRSAPLVAACEAVKARLDAGLHGGNRQLVDTVCQRADEPGELLSYWMNTHGRAVPKPVKRGVSDAAARLYNERSALKYDTDGKPMRFGDVLEIAHCSPAADKPWQGTLYKHLIDRRHKRGEEIPDSLQTLRTRASLMALPVEQRRQWVDGTETSRAALNGAAMTWEALAGWLQGPMDKAAWETVIPNMGIMALIRNLRNFDEAGVSDKVANEVIAKISDPEVVAKSRQFPFRWYSAYRNAPSLRWGHALDQALTQSTKNIPELKGRTLVLVDTSASMNGMGYSRRSEVTPAVAAALFGVAVSARCKDVDLHGFATGEFRHETKKGASVIKEVDRFVNRIGEVGHGTDIAGAVRRTYNGQDRVIIITDMQTMTGGIDQLVPQHVPMYGFNLGGYAPTMLPSTSTRVEMGSLTDAAFRIIPMIEAGRDGTWPWDDQD